MKNDSQYPVRHKPSGGVLFAVITPASNVLQAEFSDDGRRCELLRAADAESVMRCRLLEERSTFDETLTADSGAVLVTHRLTLTADRDTGAAWLEPDFADEALRHGLVAAVTLADRRTLVAGLSPKFGIGQPLRLLSLSVRSGRGATDRPTVEMVLEGNDCSFAAEFCCNEQSPISN